MRIDQFEALCEYRLSYSNQIELRVAKAVSDLLAEGRKPSFYSVAKLAGVARSTLYRCPNLKELVCNGRAAAPAPISELDRLKAENASLKKRIAIFESHLHAYRPSNQDPISYWLIELESAA